MRKRKTTLALYVYNRKENLIYAPPCTVQSRSTNFKMNDFLTTLKSKQPPQKKMTKIRRPREK